MGIKLGWLNSFQHYPREQAVGLVELPAYENYACYQKKNHKMTGHNHRSKIV
jgi:uncharacterized short protein YbdD (DUF466 family)